MSKENPIPDISGSGEAAANLPVAVPNEKFTIAQSRLAGSPDSRVYAAPFARVWDALHEEFSERRRWSVVHSDEELGLLYGLATDDARAAWTAVYGLVAGTMQNAAEELTANAA